MKTWFDSDLQLRRQMIANIAQEKNIEAATIEKDWWVTMTLKALFRASCHDFISFKGGTSVSKGWNLIDRFSEDIDLSLHHSFFGIESTTKSQREKLRKASRVFIVNEISKELEDLLHSFGIADVKVVPVTMTEGNNPHPIDSDKDPVVLRVQYPSILPTKGSYMLPFVKVEISCLSMDEPTEVIEVSSMIHDKYPTYDVDAVVTARTVRPTRTFLEKAFLLCEEFQKAKPRTQRMTRHFYDMYKMAHTPYAEEALNDIELYRRIVTHRETYYHVHYVDYSCLLPESISFLPPDHLMKWEARTNVEIINDNGTKLNTEQIFGDETNKKVFSVKKVTVTDPDGSVIVGKQGFESDMAFKNYKFLDVNGVVSLKEQYEEASEEK